MSVCVSCASALRPTSGTRFPRCCIHLSAVMWRLPKRLFTHAAIYLYTIIVIFHRLDVIAVNRWLLTNAAKRTSLTICFVCMFVLVSTRGQATMCAFPTLKRSIRKYNYSEDVRVNVKTDGGEVRSYHISAVGLGLTIITFHRNK